MSQRRGRGRWSPQTEDVCPEDEDLARRFFGEGEGGRKGSFKTAQLCKQVERAVSWALSEAGDGTRLAGALVAAVDPAPDTSRLQVTVVLAPGRDEGDLAAAWAELSQATPSFRAEVAQAISRKRVPELQWAVCLGDGCRHE